MTDRPVITHRERRLLVAAAGKLTTSSQGGEREVIFQRINRELDRLGISWNEIFERALPLLTQDADAPHATPDLTTAADAMMSGFADMMGGRQRNAPPPPPARRHLSGDEIPRMVHGAISIVDERDWRGGRMMFVTITNDEFAYGTMVIFEKSSQEVARAMEGRTVAGRVDHPRDTARLPVLHDVMVD